jgi:plastocyanin
MQRFRLLGFYLVGVAAVVGLAVWGVSLRRAATPPASGAAPSQEASTTAPISTAAARVSIENFDYNPKELVVTTGATVTWVNADDFPHTVTSAVSPPLFDSKTLDKDGEFSFQFKTPGTYDYFCGLHPYMTGKVIVK